MSAQHEHRLAAPIAHVAGVALVQSTQYAVNAMLPVIALKHFNAGPKQTVLITAAPVTLFALSIFWNAIFSRSALGRFWIIYWLIACLPLGLAGFADQFWHLAAATIASSVGIAGFHPAAGELLKRLYPDNLRGAVYGRMQCIVMVLSGAIAFGLGTCLHRDELSFRWFLPAAAAYQGVGVFILWRLAHATGIEGQRYRSTEKKGVLATAAEPLSHMGEVLRNDARFKLYEVAFMTYGVGWMICTALVPTLASRKLNLDYQAIGLSVSLAYMVSVGLSMIPAGRLLDALGPAKATSLAFLGLTLYPLGLMFAWDERSLFAITVLYGITHAGVSAGWMLGPVAFAPSSDKVPQYVAIHATLVGVRGSIFQGVGVWLYSITGSFAPPLAIAAGSFLLAASQMRLLERGKTNASKNRCRECGQDLGVVPIPERCPACGGVC